MGSHAALAGTNQKSTLVEEVKNTYSNPRAACEKSCDDGVLIGKTGHDVTLKDPPSRYDVPSLVATHLSKPDADTSNIDNNSKVQDSGSTNDEHVNAKEKVHNKKAGKKGTKSQQGSRFFKPKSTFIYRPVSKPSLEDSDDEVDKVLMPDGGGFLDYMEDYYDRYEDQGFVAAILIVMEKVSFADLDLGELDAPLRVLRNNESDVTATNPNGGTGIDGLNSYGMFTSTVDASLPEGDGVSVAPTAGRFKALSTSTKEVCSPFIHDVIPEIFSSVQQGYGLDNIHANKSAGDGDHTILNPGGKLNTSSGTTMSGEQEGKYVDGFQTVGTKHNNGKSGAPRGGTKVGQKFFYQPKNVASTSSNVSNPQVPNKSNSSNATTTKSAPSSSNASNVNVKNVNSGPQLEVNKSSAKQQNLAKEIGIKLTNSFDALNEEMENDSNVIQTVDEPDGEDDLLHEHDETSAFMATTSKGVTNTTGAIYRGWKWTSNGSLCDKGSHIILGWDDAVIDVLLMSQTNQVMHVQVNVKADNKAFFVSFVYANNYYIDQRVLWHELEVHGSLMRDKPWVLLGDFNASLFMEDKSVLVRISHGPVAVVFASYHWSVIRREWFIVDEGFAKPYGCVCINRAGVIAFLMMICCWLLDYASSIILIEDANGFGLYCALARRGNMIMGFFMFKIRIS
ncbi:RNA-directed DNA polymerase, eukaryota, Reverse transcriptase zinc-binding domain protein [Artemisia annua]|uniref:RNA-directed DNA polymerase, eukaryota, Reverse transcriptase zinc-binding domain protein n=1 Tax=Artemisia annua TaxID=35608 RepID=A0A2U1M319_ARTAN|nr:RNA-directed DNA polymerase, eukaryota, Reverse transcriptase zinc-binding domain protein [Artemisia annua]